MENSSPVGSCTGISHFLDFYSTFKVFIPLLRLLLLFWDKITPINESRSVDFYLYLMMEAGEMMDSVQCVFCFITYHYHKPLGL